MPLMLVEPSTRDLPDGSGPVDPPDDFDGGDGPGGDGDGDGEPIDWVVVASFGQPMEAHLAVAKLESEGIDCFLDNENLIATDWLYANAVGGVKLSVPREDAGRARDLLRLEPRPEEETEPDPDPVEAVAARCPECGSSDVYRDRLIRKVFFTAWLVLELFAFAFIDRAIGLAILGVGLALLFVPRKWKCGRCGAQFHAEQGRGFEVIGKDGAGD